MKNYFLTGAFALAMCTLAVSTAAQGQQQVHIPDMSSYILTPLAPDTPRINCAKIFGVRPHSEFLFTIATSGKRPMSFSADQLPPGLKLDTATGQITGRLNRKGEYKVTLHAHNALGNSSRILRIIVGDEIALTPPMGWNSWNCWGNSINQDIVLRSAQAMRDKGLTNYGWTYINIDDSWQSMRGGKYNAIQPNREFKDIATLSRKIHDMGMKIGIYSGPWVGTYSGHVGTMCDHKDGTYDWITKKEYNERYRYVVPKDPNGDVVGCRNRYHGKYSFALQDAKQWEEWGIDYLKYDWWPNDYYFTKEMSDILHTLHRDIVFSVSNDAPYGEAPVLMRYTNCWRTTWDIRDTWESISKIGFQMQDRWIAFNRPGHWADPDMLVVGVVGWGQPLHYTRLTADEQYTHLSLWALMAAPMLIGCDMTQLDPFTTSLLCNNEVNDIDQDPLGLQAYPIRRDTTSVIYAKHLEDGSMAVGLFNISMSAKQMSFTLKDLGLRGVQKVRDLWRQKDVAELTDQKSYTSTVSPHGVMLVKVYPGNSHERAIESPIKVDL